MERIIHTLLFVALILTILSLSAVTALKGDTHGAAYYFAIACAMVGVWRLSCYAHNFN